MSEWKPIETAPKDKTSILLYVKSQTTDYEFIIEARYFKGEDPPWLSFYASHPESHILGWMPLPEPPKKKHCCTCHVTNETCQEKDGKLYLVDRDGTFARYHINYCPFCGEKA